MSMPGLDLLPRPPTAWAEIAFPAIDFRLPPELEAGEPPEARGLARDQVRLMVSYYPNGELVHTCFRSLPDVLDPGDVLVINTSATLNAAIPAVRTDGEHFELHLSTRLPGDLWVVELRLPGLEGSTPFHSAREGEVYDLPGGGRTTLLLPYRSEQRGSIDHGQVRLWLASLDLPESLYSYLDQHGQPIRYGYVRQSWPLSYYQTVFAAQPGSAEMPSAGRAFTPELLTRLVSKGVIVTPLVLHTGVSSLEAHEPPYDEYFSVPQHTADTVNLARRSGRRVVAVGTTVIRALETVSAPDGAVHAGQGWTDLVITPQSGLCAVDGLLTGFHEPQSSHLAMLAALAGFEHIEQAYQAALAGKYLWHEFGDLHLLLPR